MSHEERIKDLRFDQLSTDLKKDIGDYLKKHGRYAGWLFWIKAIILLVTWGFLYIFIVFFSPESETISYLLSMTWGLCSLLIIFNIGHDAVHGVISKFNSINQILKYSFNLVGGNAYSWKLKHNIAHHTYTNIEGADFDTDLSPLMRLSPKTSYKKQYQWQHFTFILIYPLLSLLIVFVSDFKIFSQAKKAKHVTNHPLKEWIILLLSKLWYLQLVFTIPLLYSSYSITQILVAFLSFHLLNGLVIACVFMPSHYFPGSNYYECKENEYNWFEHQIGTTMDLSPRSHFISLILGGLNLNIAHHLYSKFCHTHYYQLAKIIKKRARFYGITYHELPYPKALIAHFKYLNELKSKNA